MGTITDTIDVDVDRKTAYNQWTQFEEFPKFMAGVQEVRQLSDDTLHWVTKVGPVVREYDAVITEQRPDELIAWHSTSGPDNAGRVTFRDAGENRTQVTAEITLDPEGLIEEIGDKSGAIDARVNGDLRRFKEFIEGRGGEETGAWRGTIDSGTEPDTSMGSHVGSDMGTEMDEGIGGSVRSGVETEPDLPTRPSSGDEYPRMRFSERSGMGLE